jgi:hypothetical protein
VAGDKAAVGGRLRIFSVRRTGELRWNDQGIGLNFLKLGLPEELMDTVWVILR